MAILNQQDIIIIKGESVCVFVLKIYAIAVYFCFSFLWRCAEVSKGTLRRQRYKLAQSRIEGTVIRIEMAEHNKAE